jgi:hypothetical protein
MKYGATYPIFAPITTETPGSAIVYGTPVVDMKTMVVNLSWTRNEIKMYANDALAERDNAVMEGTISFDADNVTNTFKLAALAHLAATSPSTHQSVTDDVSTAGGFGWIEKHLVNGVKKFVHKWLYKVGFSLVEVLSPCPTNWKKLIPRVFSDMAFMIFSRVMSSGIIA